LLPVALLAVDPGAFHGLSLEGGLVENLSALLCFGAGAVFAAAALRLWLRSRRNRRAAIAAAGLAAVLFLIGGEEISWFQQFLSYESPELFAGNRQGEMNLHNFATKEFENAYYLGCMILLVLVPFLTETTGRGRQGGWAAFVPDRGVLYIASVFTAYNYDMWRGPLTQLGFFLTLFILFHYVLISRGRRRAQAAVVLLVTLVTQSGFLWFGRQSVRIWDVTEYKELLIPLALSVYAILTLRRANASSSLSASSSTMV